MALYTLLLITLRVASALAQSSISAESPTSTAAPDTSGDVNAEYKLWGYDGCSSSQINDIKSGFSEMVIMVMGEGTIITKYPKIDWNSAVAQDFWGPAERNRVYRDLIQSETEKRRLLYFAACANVGPENLDRLASVSYDFWIDSSASWLQVRRDDPRKFCDSINALRKTRWLPHTPSITSHISTFALATSHVKLSRLP
jgi:hypothetical protein